jgi:hypothetical protein
MAGDSAFVVIAVPLVALSLAALFGSAGAVVGKVLRITIAGHRTA